MRYEYTTISLDCFGDLKELNDLGSSGWRVIECKKISQYKYWVLLERPLA